MLKKKSGSGEKKRKHLQSEERHDGGKRRSTESSQQSLKDDLADAELDRIGSDIEEGGLDLSLPFQPITAYIGDKQEMLEQCFHVLGEKRLQKMLPDELKDCNLNEIKKLCREQLESISEKNLIQILAGEDLTSGNGDDVTNKPETMESQQDNNVDSTSCFKETAKTEDSKQEGVGSGEESDVLSINADAYDSDIEGPKEEQTVKAGAGKVEDDTRELVAPAVNSESADPEPPTGSPPAETKRDIQSDIDKSVSEILAYSSTSSREVAKEQCVLMQSSDVTLPVQGGPVSSRAPSVCQPSIQQLELLELEMRARAIKALMKASTGKNPTFANNS